MKPQGHRPPDARSNLSPADLRFPAQVKRRHPNLSLLIHLAHQQSPGALRSEYSTAGMKRDVRKVLGQSLRICPDNWLIWPSRVMSSKAAAASATKMIRKLFAVEKFGNSMIGDLRPPLQRSSACLYRAFLFVVRVCFKFRFQITDSQPARLFRASVKRACRYRMSRLSAP